MTKRKNKLNRANRRRRDTSHIQRHDDLRIVEGAFLVITINNNRQKQTESTGDKSLLAQLPEYLERMRRIRIEVICHSADHKRAREDTARTTKLLTNLKNILNRFQDVDILEVAFHMQQHNLDQPNLPQLQAALPLYGLKFEKWTLHLGWSGSGRPIITEVKENSKIDRQIREHPWLRFKNERLKVTLNHTELNHDKTYDDENEEVQESFFKVLPFYLKKTKHLLVEVTPLRREYLLVDMFQKRKKIIDKLVKLINRCCDIEFVKVVFRIHRCELKYLAFASCFHGFNFHEWEFVFHLIEGGNRKTIVDRSMELEIEKLHERGLSADDVIEHFYCFFHCIDQNTPSSTSSDSKTLSGLPVEVILGIVENLSPNSAACLSTCNQGWRNLIARN
ncbi:hypothetical protein EAF04_002017 [Stromatinia cepivora]|nr:hypothetical protein EAF04_002017 [Stromatinia cepivora]